MITSHPAKAAFLSAALVLMPVIAQGEPGDLLPGEADFMSTMFQPTGSGSSNIILPTAELGKIGKGTSDSYDVVIDNNMDVIGQFMHQSAAEPASQLQDHTIGWIEWSKDAVISSAQYANGWIAARSSDVAYAGQNAYEWLSAHTSFIGSAAYDATYDATDWVSEKSQTLGISAKETTDWIARSTKQAATSAVGTVSDAISGVTVMGSWSEDFLNEVKKRLTDHKTSEFGKLIEESGFVLRGVKVGIGLIPELDVEFKHLEDLTPEELAEFQRKVDAYAQKASGPIGYLETVLLRNLASAGELSEGLSISELHIDLFPLPGFNLVFDPFDFEEKHTEKLEDADLSSKVSAARLMSLEARLNKLEAELEAARSASAR